MRPTSLRLLVGCTLAAGLAGYLVGLAAYGSLPPLPRYAPVLTALLALAELGMARVVRDRVQRRPGRPSARPLHPLQVVRAVALAKASSLAGALAGGGYIGLLLWLLPRTAAQAREDAVICAVSAAAAALLVAAALLLERSGRVPPTRVGS